jgi:hypothetical protein
MGTHSAIYKDLRKLCEDLRIQAALVTQVSELDCEKWQRGIIEDSINAGHLESDFDLKFLHRFLSDPSKACSQFYLSFVQFFLRLTSVLELFLKNLYMHNDVYSVSSIYPL